MYPQLGDKKEEDLVLRKIYKTSVKASYFNNMEENKFTNKSKIQIESINQEEEEVDLNTFRITTNFVRPDDSFVVYFKSGRVHIEQQSFFSCISSRKGYEMELRNNRLKVIKSQSQIVHFFNFDTEQVQVKSKGSYFTLKVQHCQKTFYFEPVEQKGKESMVEEWVKQLNKVIDVTLGKKKHYSYLPIKIKNFYSQEHISHEQFQRSCNSLDLVLFRSPHSAASIQRLFTNSQYDHVGLVLRNRKNQIFIYESTSGQGVGLTPWKHIIKFQWYDSTDKIAWRRLNIKLSNQDIATIEAFVTKTLGKQFQITLQKLLVFNSALKRSNQEQQKKTYFCSQLVARLYKELQLLEAGKSSSQYYPVDFSEKIRLTMKRQGVFLEQQRVLAFGR